MDFSDTSEEAAYRAQVCAWLDANAPDRLPRTAPTSEQLRAAKDWQAKKAAAGYAQISWAKEWGGPGGTTMQNVIYNQEEGRRGLATGFFGIGLGMCIPTVIAFADEVTKKRFVGPALRGEEIWCQLFSEPAGGSDLAAVRTSAVPDGDDWVVNGQKIWTSGAHYSDYGIVVTRTNRDAPKHKGLTMFWVDMTSPGIEVRPINQMSGESGFNEVFFTDVRIPDGQRLGAVDNGWKVSLVTLMNERLSIGGGGGGADYARFMELARGQTVGDEPALAHSAFREKIADWYVRTEGMKHTRMRSLTALSRGETPGPENSIGKVVAALQALDVAECAIDMLDAYGIIDDPELSPMRGAFQSLFLGMPGLRIAGGTDEILRNIIAERVLGLPGEIRVDKDVAFKDLPAGR